MRQAPLLRVFAGATFPPALTTCALALALLTLAGLGQALLAASASPAPSLLWRLILGTAGAVAPLALGVGALAGVAGGVARLREEGALLALATLGLGRAPLAALCGAFALPAALGWLWLAHQGEPLARAALRDARAEAAASVEPRADRAVRLGSWWLALDDGGALVFTDGTTRGRADRWLLEAREGGVLASLSGAVLTRGDVSAEAASFTLPVPVSARGKAHVSERTTPELLVQLRTSAALGRDAYERWLLYKRSLLPALLLPLAVAAGGLARRAPAGAVVAALTLGAWAAVRLCDAQVASLGSPLAGGGLLGLATLAAVLGWRR